MTKGAYFGDLPIPLSSSSEATVEELLKSRPIASSPMLARRSVSSAGRMGRDKMLHRRISVVSSSTEAETGDLKFTEEEEQEEAEMLHSDTLKLLESESERSLFMPFSVVADTECEVFVMDILDFVRHVDGQQRFRSHTGDRGLTVFLCVFFRFVLL